MSCSSILVHSTAASASFIRLSLSTAYCADELSILPQQTLSEPLNYGEVRNSAFGSWKFSEIITFLFPEFCINPISAAASECSVELSLWSTAAERQLGHLYGETDPSHCCKPAHCRAPQPSCSYMLKLQMKILKILSVFVFFKPNRARSMIDNKTNF